MEIVKNLLSLMSLKEKEVSKNMDNQKGISRRSFIKGMGGVAAAATVLSIPGLKAKAEPIPVFITLPKDTLLEMYRRMQRIRQGELLLRQMHTDQDPKYYYPTTGLRGACHTSAGEEATCVGVAMAMNKGDYLSGSHRAHGYPLALGLDLKAWMAELFGKVTGSNRGHGGSMHIAEPAIGMLGMSGLVGAQVSHMVGAAKAARVKGTNQVAVSTNGDGAMNTSGFNSSLNLAAIWNAPVVFVINNNQWQSETPNNLDQGLVMAGKDLSTRATGFGIPGITVDGNDIFAVNKAAKYCIDRARQGKGPSLLECVTYRQWSHSGPLDHEVTRSWPESETRGWAELNYWLNRDPIKRFERTVLDGKMVTEAELDTIRKEVAAGIDEAVKFAISSPFPDPEEEFKYARETYGA